MFNSETQGWSFIIQLLKICDDSLKNRLNKIFYNKTLLKQKRLVEFVECVSTRDFKGYTVADIQSQFIRYLMEDSLFHQYKEIRLDEDTNPKVDTKTIRYLLERHFTQESFANFLENREIPFIKNSTIEDMINITLAQFQFEEA